MKVAARIAFALAAAWLGFEMPAHIVTVHSPSIEGRLFWRAGGEISQGDYVTFQRTIPWTGSRERMTKRVACMPGEHLAAGPAGVMCENRFLGVARAHGSRGQELGAYRFAGSVPPGWAYVAGSHPASYDSRYYGLVELTKLERVVRLW